MPALRSFFPVLLTIAVRYDRIHGRDAVQLLPRVQVGIVEGLQVNLALPYTVGSGRRYNPGSTGGGLLYDINREKDCLPAFAVALDYSAPIGPERRSAEVGLTGIAPKTVTPSVDRRLNLNVAWLRSVNPNEKERRDRYRVIAGYSQLDRLRRAVAARCSTILLPLSLT